MLYQIIILVSRAAVLEYVWAGMISRKGAYFVLGQAYFAAECGQFGEKYNAA